MSTHHLTPLPNAFAVLTTTPLSYCCFFFSLSLSLGILLYLNLRNTLVTEWNDDRQTSKKTTTVKAGICTMVVTILSDFEEECPGKGMEWYKGVLREAYQSRRVRDEEIALHSTPLIPTIIRNVRRGVCKSSSVADFCASIIACRNLSNSRASGRDIGLYGGTSHPILTKVLQCATLWCISLSPKS